MSPKPAWILISGCVLAFMAAAVNATFVIGLGVSVGNLTDNVSKFAAEAAAFGRGGGGALAAAQLAMAIAGFTLGAGAAGYYIHHPKLELTRPYGRALAGAGALLLASSWLAGFSAAAAICLAAAACGMQNGLATHYRGMILRTTHITGLLTDLGVHLGMRLKGHEIPAWKILVPLAMGGSFFCGAFAGALLTISRGDRALALLGALYLAGGAIWAILRQFVFKFV